MTSKRSQTAPKHLALATKRWWLSVVTDYELEPHHTRLLTLAAEAWDRCQAARELIAEKGLLFETHLGEMRANPAVAIERDSRLAFARLLRELDLDISVPSSDVRPPRLRSTNGLAWNKGV
jgi:P27 family predicted phage terminase small subunit